MMSDCNNCHDMGCELCAEDLAEENKRLKAENEALRKSIKKANSAITTSIGLIEDLVSGKNKC